MLPNIKKQSKPSKLPKAGKHIENPNKVSTKVIPPCNVQKQEHKHDKTCETISDISKTDCTNSTDSFQVSKIIGCTGPTGATGQIGPYWN